VGKHEGRERALTTLAGHLAADPLEQRVVGQEKGQVLVDGTLREVALIKIHEATNLRGGKACRKGEERRKRRL